MFTPHAADGFVEAAPGVQRKTLCFGERTTLTEFRLTRGGRLPGHSHPHEQTGYLVSGRLALTIGAETHDVLPGDGWCIPPDVNHGALVVEDAVAIEVFSPVREGFLPA